MNVHLLAPTLLHPSVLGDLINWYFVFHYLAHPYILQGVAVTIVLAVAAQFMGVVLGLVLYFLRRSRFWPLSWFARAYVLVVRGTPLLVQVLFLAVLFEQIPLGKFLAQFDPFGALNFAVQVPFDAFVAAVAALSINEGAYMAEIIRAGIDSIDTGQLEAAKSLGMTYALAMRRIVLPQAARVIIPPLGNEFNGMLKNTSLAYAISVGELLFTSYKTFGPAFGATLEFLIIASFWYLVMTTVWGIVQAIIERRLNASNIDPALRERGSWLQRAFGLGRGRASIEPIPGVAAPVPLDHR
jgi:polar amino acid transport system permease protein